MVRSVEELRFDIQDVAVLAFDFFRFDYRSVGNETIHQSVWVYYFTGEYLRAVHRQTLRDVDDFAVPFLALPEVQAVPIWRELYEIGESMTNWVRTQRAWKRPRKLGGYFSAAWWSSFTETHEINTSHPMPPDTIVHRFPHDHPLVGHPGTGYDPEETPHGLPPLVDVLTTEFLI
jgi:hypothetical protein